MLIAVGYRPVRARNACLSINARQVSFTIVASSSSSMTVAVPATIPAQRHAKRAKGYGVDRQSVTR